MNLKTTFLVLTTLLLCLGMFFYGLKPKGFRLKNTASRLTESNGIYFGNMGIAFTKPFSLQDFQAGDSLSIELFLKIPAKNDREQSTIIQLWNKSEHISVQLNQWQKFLIVEKKYNHFFKDSTAHFSKGIEQNKNHHIVITGCKTGTGMYIDGVQTGYSGNLPILDNNKSCYQLILGNSADASTSWPGKLFALFLYPRVLSENEITSRYKQFNTFTTVPKTLDALAAYSFIEHGGTIVYNSSGVFNDLYIPPTFQILNKQFLSMPWKDLMLNGSTASDLFMNFFGFIPFGFLFTALLCNTNSYFKKNRLFITLLAGTLISLFFEITQAFVPTRSSQLSDLLLNIFGTGTGFLLYTRFIVRSLMDKNR
jgi:hypothetical protein